MGHVVLPCTDPNFRLLLERVPAILWTTDRDLNITSAAGSGVVKLASVGTSFRKLVEVGDASPVALAALERALNGECVFYSSQWRNRSYSTRIEPCRDEWGNIAGCVGVALDETDRLASEAKLEESLSLLQATIESTADGILVVDLAGQITLCNARFREIWRLPTEVMAGKEDARAIAEATTLTSLPERFLQRIKEIYAQPELETFDTIELKDGRVVKRLSLPQRIGGKPVGRVWSFRDITPRVVAERASARLLREAQEARAEADAARERAEALARASRILAASLDYDSTLRAIARAALPRFADYAIVDVVERGLFRRIAAEHHDPAKADLMRELMRYSAEYELPLGVAHAISAREPTVELGIDESKLRPRQGSAMTGPRDSALGATLQRIGLRAYMTVPMFARGCALGAISFCSGTNPRCFGPVELAFGRELADRAALAVDHARLYGEARAAERDAREAVRMREEFLSIASHELRTPLTALYLAVQTLGRAASMGVTGAGAGAFSRSIASVEREARRFEKLVHDLLDVSRIASGTFLVEPEDLELTSAARDAAAQFGDELQRSGSAVSIDAPEPVSGRWDRSGLERILANLLSNAVKNGEGKPIEISVRADASNAYLTVRDHGVGITPKMRERLFERSLGPTRGGGMGLGLYIVRAIVDAHGGRIQVESTPGGGAVFTVILPRAAAHRPGVHRRAA